MKTPKKNKIPLPLTITLCSAIVASICFLYLMGSLYYRVNHIGKTIGDSFGELEGEIRGGIEGYYDGKEQGKEAGLQANDITIDIGTNINLSGKYQIQATSIEYVDKNQIGSEAAVLAKYSAEIIYEINLDDIQINAEDDEIILTIPEVIGTINLNSTPEKLDEWYKKGTSTDREDGIDAALKSESELRKKITEELSEEEYYNEKVIKAAEEQMKDLVNRLLIDKKDIKVQFKNKGIVSYETN